MFPRPRIHWFLAPAGAGRAGAGAFRPAAGARLTAIPPEKLALQVLRACECRRPELVIPAKTRLLFALAQLWPSFADWILKN